jgi:ketosteroid isomerase-like protein
VTDSTDRAVLINELFKAIDVCDVDRFLTFLDPDATFRFGSAPSVTGHDAITVAVTGFFETIEGLQHDLINTVSSGSMQVCEGDVTYTRLDGSNVTLPFVNIFEFDEGLICDYRIYVDVAPLYS